MNSNENTKYDVSVRREDLQKAVSVLSGILDAHTRWASITMCNGQLSLTAGESNQVIPANGQWPDAVYFRVNWVRKMAALLAKTDPIRLRVQGGHLLTNSYSIPCRFRLTYRSNAGKLERQREKQCVERAAKILAPFFIRTEDIEALVAEATMFGEPRWQPGQSAMINATAKAWAVLAPLGVEIDDIRVLMEESIRHALVRKA
ncbi:MAG: hypothetical protein M1568_00555 [Acidobacteria bacterium]|nr:hypothetical protein [Acidobacteriota bacterium]